VTTTGNTTNSLELELKVGGCWDRAGWIGRTDWIGWTGGIGGLDSKRVIPIQPAVQPVQPIPLTQPE
jgi:hypothetical protein